MNIPRCLVLKLRHQIPWVNRIFRQNERFITLAANEHRWTLFKQRFILNFNGALLKNTFAKWIIAYSYFLSACQMRDD